MTITQLKQQARNKVLRRIRQIPRTTRDGHAKAIAAQLLSLPAYRKATAILGFVPLSSEPDLSSFYDQAIIDGKVIAFPRCEADGSMRYFAMDGQWRDRLTKGELSFREPDGTCTIPLNLEVHQPSLVLVPALAYTPYRRRLGRGKGYFDRFLASLGSGATSVGICFNVQIEADLPFEVHDHAVHLVITESARY
jgi:5-formyltetrahydrofolate cyclo-ligase